MVFFSTPKTSVCTRRCGCMLDQPVVSGRGPGRPGWWPSQAGLGRPRRAGCAGELGRAGLTQPGRGRAGSGRARLVRAELRIRPDALTQLPWSALRQLSQRSCLGRLGGLRKVGWLGLPYPRHRQSVKLKPQRRIQHHMNMANLNAKRTKRCNQSSLARTLKGTTPRHHPFVKLKPQR